MTDLAAPGDRLAAAIIDLSVILVPMILLVSSPFRLLFMRSLLLHRELEFLLSIAAISSVVVVLTLAYTTMMTSLVGATLGKMVFGLRVIDIWNQRNLTVTAAFFRSLTWSLSLTFAGLPFLSILSNDKRRPWHDRISDSIVVSTGKTKLGAPNVYEKMFVQSILGSVSAIFVVGLMIVAPLLWESVQSAGLLPFSGSHAYAFCDEVDWALNEWPSVETRNTEKRLNVVLTLFAAGEVSKSCLEKEAQKFLVSESSESATAYLAQAFVHSENPELSNRYLSKVCELAPKSSSCVMSQVVEDWSDSNWRSVEDHFASFVDHTPLHISVWALRHFLKRREYNKAEKFLNKLSSQPSLANFLTQQRIRLLLGTGRDLELSAVAMTAIETLPSEGRLKVAQQICEFEIKNQSCVGTRTRPCQILKKEALSDHSILMSAETAIQVARVVVCSEGDKDFRKLLAMMPMQETHDYAVALKDKLDGRFLQARKGFERLAEFQDISPKMREHLQLEVLSLMQSPDEFYAEFEAWRQKEPNLHWGRQGETLLDYAVRHQQFEQAVKIGKLLTGERFKQTSTIRPYVFSLLETGDSVDVNLILDSSWGLAQLQKQEIETTRTPASANSKKSKLERFHKELKQIYSKEASL
ncbi:MAG: RDD family protein [Pseudomonadota bacterium]